MDQANINNVNTHLVSINEAVERLRQSVIILVDTLDYLDDTIESVEIYAGIIEVYMVEEERKEKLRCESK